MASIALENATVRDCLKHILKLKSQNKTTSERLSLYPIRDPDLFAFWTRQREVMWVAKEIDFRKDYDKFIMLTPEQQAPLLNVLRIFQILDSEVVEGPVMRFALEATSIEEEMVYMAQGAEESEHVESYSLQFKAIIPDPIKRKELIDEIDNIEWIHDFKNYLDKYVIDEDHPLPIVLASQAIMEGAGFQQFFAIIFWYNHSPFVQDIPGVTASNDLIATAEALHSEIAIYRFNREMQKLRSSGVDVSDLEKRVLELFDEMEAIVKKSLDTIIPVDLMELTKENVLNYSITILEKIKVKMGFKSTRQTVNNLKYMEKIGAPKKQNFYERDVTKYSRGESRVANADGDDDF